MKLAVITTSPIGKKSLIALVGIWQKSTMFARPWPMLKCWPKNWTSCPVVGWLIRSRRKAFPIPKLEK